ncbi:class I SAM-dependent methyltransferase [Flavobacterium sp. W22_SRS_FK3]|uniref:class I SAM-dependent methyltransferase n=1 Tax=Flavobacterium sp. W22_SRS_FK3 TaxID=3240275 RepID=UPI003F932414
MIFNKETTLISVGDFIDVYHKIKIRGIQFFLYKFSKFSYKNRVSSKWNSFVSQSDFWIIPEIPEIWNYKISGNVALSYEDYVCNNYFKGKENLSLLAVGCGEGKHERNFAKYSIFNNIVGIDISKDSVENAKILAAENNLKINYFCDDFRKTTLLKGKFDVVLFDSSLHHFDKIEDFLKNNILPILNENGYVIVFEYCGPNRLQWRKSQLNEANKILKSIPLRFKKLIDGKSIKTKVFRPGLLRMLVVDPSEAPDSENLVRSLNNNLEVLEEKKLGTNILHILLKGIAHNFLAEDVESKMLIHNLIEKENEFLSLSGENDAIFGVYQKRTY